MARATNVALGAASSASAFCDVPENGWYTPPSYSFDGTLCFSDACASLSWNACAGPPQWILGEWGYPAVVDSVRLNVNQLPDGIARHEIRFRDPSPNTTTGSPGFMPLIRDTSTTI